MKLKKFSLLLGVTIQDALNAPNAQDHWTKSLVLLETKKMFTVKNATKKTLLISQRGVGLGLDWTPPLEWKRMSLLRSLSCRLKTLLLSPWWRPQPS